jgi:cardiolipin synthase
MVGNIPNLITLARLLILPFFAATLIYKEYKYALILFIAAAISDVLDGFIARITNQITDLGKILDPVADKFFIITSFVIMSNIEMIPKWLAIIVISKDLIVVTGCFIIYFVTHNLKIEPTILGKLSSGLQFITIGVVILSFNMEKGIQLTLPFFIIVATVTGLAGIQYVYRGMKTAQTDNT